MHDSDVHVSADHVGNGQASSQYLHWKGNLVPKVESA